MHLKKYHLKTKVQKKKKIKEEADILSEFKSEYIVNYIDSCEDRKNNTFNILMEYCENLNLKFFIEKYNYNNKLIPKDLVYNIISNICIGLKEMHQKNIIHRDLKPENIFITKDDKIKIGDFGLSRQLESDDDNYSNSFNATLNYTPFGDIEERKINKKFDMYSLGCIFYELCTTKLYFTTKFVEQKQVEIDTKVYPKEWLDIIKNLVNDNKADRPDIEKVCNMLKKKPQPIGLFANCKGIKSVKIISCSKNIDIKGMFEGCDNLKDLIVPQHLYNRMKEEMDRLDRKDVNLNSF